MLVSHLYALENYLFSSLAHFLIGSFIFLVLSCLYIFEINSLSVASFAIIFSHSEGCLFTGHSKPVRRDNAEGWDGEGFQDVGHMYTHG